MQKKTITRGLAALAILAITCSALAQSQPRGSERGREHITLNTVQLGDLPAAAQKVLQERAQGATIERITASPVFYMIELTVDGTQKAVWVNGTGTAIEGPGPLPKGGREWKGMTVTSWPDLPAAVRNLVSTKFHGIPVGEIRKSAVIYRATLKQGAERRELLFTENGQVPPMIKHITKEGKESEPVVWDQVRADQEREEAFRHLSLRQLQEQADNDPVVRHQMSADGFPGGERVPREHRAQERE